MINLISTQDYAEGFKKAIELSNGDYIFFKLDQYEIICNYLSNIFLFDKKKNVIIEEFLLDKKKELNYDFHDFYKLWKIFDGQIFFISNKNTLTLQKNMNIVFDKIFEINSINNKNIEKIIKENLISKNLNFDNEVIKYLSMILDYDYKIIDNEIEKLSLLCKKNITKKDVDEVCSFSNNEAIFKIVDYFLQKKNSQAYNLLVFFVKRNRTSIEQLFSMFVSQIFKIKVYCYHYKKNFSIDKILQDFKLNYFQINSFKSFFNSNSFLYIDKILNELFEIDFHVKKDFKNRYELFTLFILKEYDL